MRKRPINRLTYMIKNSEPELFFVMHKYLASSLINLVIVSKRLEGVKSFTTITFIFPISGMLYQKL